MCHVAAISFILSFLFLSFLPLCSCCVTSSRQASHLDEEQVFMNNSLLCSQSFLILSSNNYDVVDSGTLRRSLALFVLLSHIYAWTSASSISGCSTSRLAQIALHSEEEMRAECSDILPPACTAQCIVGKEIKERAREDILIIVTCLSDSLSLRKS